MNTGICVVSHLLTSLPAYPPRAELVKNFASSSLTLSQGYFTGVPRRWFRTQVPQTWVHAVGSEMFGTPRSRGSY